MIQVDLEDKNGKKKPEIRQFSTGANRNSDVAWASGFYDGEGSVSCTVNNGIKDTRIALSLGQKDFNGEVSDTLLRFQKIVGCGHIYRKRRIGKEINQHQFYCCKPFQIQEIIRMFWNNLSIAKRVQAQKAFWRFTRATGREIECPK